MSLYIEHLIDEIRNHTENEDFSNSIGIKDAEFIRFINDAQYRIHSLIVQQHQDSFLKEKEIDVVASTEAYSLPSDIYLNNRIRHVFYKDTSNDKDYYLLKPATLNNRQPGYTGYPSYYIRTADKILLNPVPAQSNAKIKLYYTRMLPRVDKRRARVGAVTLDNATNSITSLSFNITTESIDIDALEKRNFFSVIDRNGNIKMKDIEYDSIDTGTGVVTITNGFTYEDGESISVDDYIVPGKNSATHLDLPESIERYVIAYTSWKILKRDSSVDSSEAIQELSEMESEIVASYANLQGDIYEIPLINDDIDGWF